MKDETKKVMDTITSAYSEIPTSSLEEPEIEYISPPSTPPRSPLEEEKEEKEDADDLPAYVSPNKRKPPKKELKIVKIARSRSKSVTRKKQPTRKKKNKTKKKNK